MKDRKFALPPYNMKKFIEKHFTYVNENFPEYKKNTANKNLINKIVYSTRKYEVHVLHKLKQNKNATTKNMRRNSPNENCHNWI